jgi:HEAT repeat protein
MLWWKLQQLKPSGWENRAEAAASLREAHENKSVPALVKALDDDHAATRLEVVRALGEIGDPRGAEPLAALIEENQVVPNEYGDILESIRAAAEALACRPCPKPMWIAVRSVFSRCRSCCAEDYEDWGHNTYL